MRANWILNAKQKKYGNNIWDAYKNKQNIYGARHIYLQFTRIFADLNIILLRIVACEYDVCFMLAVDVLEWDHMSAMAPQIIVISSYCIKS